VVVDPEEPIDFPAPWITCTHVAGARQAAQHLVGLGHTRIGVLGWGTHVMATVDRTHGLRRVMAEAGLALEERLVRYGDHAETSDGYALAGQLLDLPEPPTAIFALNDSLAFGVLRAAAHRGISVPGQLSVVGFDDLETASLVTPMLTTVHQPLLEMGAYAARVLLRWIEGDAPPAMHIQLPTELVVRESTGPAPAPAR
jgi:LacI family transcriptional regulator